MTAAFHDALKLRLRLAMSALEYDFELPKHGAAFDAETMTADRPPAQLAPDPFVLVCSRPIIRSVARNRAGAANTQIVVQAKVILN